MKKANNNWLFAFIWGTTGYIIEVRYICFTIIVTPMAENEDKPALKIDFEGFDPFGLKSAAELSKDATKFGLEAAKVFLNATCKPLLEEFGLGLRDKFTNWRLTNIINMLEKAQGKLCFNLETQTLKIDPRVAYQIVENVSTISDDSLQEMWAGLFAASC